MNQQSLFESTTAYKAAPKKGAIKLPENVTVQRSPIFQEVQCSYKADPSVKLQDPANSSKIIYNTLLTIWNEDRLEYVEEFVVLMLNRANKVIAWVKISTGGQAGTVCDPKIIFQHALLANASSIILSHNHPSGTRKPSQADLDITRKIKNAGAFLDITVLDHIIMTAHGYLSFTDEGLL